MKLIDSFFTSLFNMLLTDKFREKIERIILFLALISFIVHLIVIYLIDFGVINIMADSDLLRNPISAIYTPFSFILIYEVYLLIYYLPRSFTTYITKQYEIITLIVIRKLFKDLAAIELSSDWFANKDDLQFTYDILAALILFFLIYYFQKFGKKRIQKTTTDFKVNIERFINTKRKIAVVLIPLFFTMATVTLIEWVSNINFASNELPTFESINNLFFDQFFTVLILIDVIILLISFFYTDQFHKIIRNSGFIVSTILIRISFGVSGIVNTALIIVAVLFGLGIVMIHNKYESDSLIEDV